MTVIEVIIYLSIGMFIGQQDLFNFAFSSVSASIVYLVLFSIILIPRLGARGVYLLLGFYIANLFL